MSLRIAYLSTHYPSVSHTFIQGEIVTLAHHGVDVVPMALNPPHDADLLTDLDRREAGRTFYVKGVPKLEAAAAIVSTATRHPVAFVRGVARALRVGGVNLGLTAKLLLQFLEAILVFRHCRRHDVTALHAHFGQAPATVAWFTAAFGNDAGRRRWTWSVTIHGWHEFVTEDTSRLRSKLAAADLVVCVSSYTRAQLMRIAEPGDRAKISVVRCGIDLDGFPPRPQRLVSAQPAVLVTARLSPEKGHHVLISALAALRAEGVDVRARFIGEGPARGELEKAASRHGVADLVDFLGAQPPERVADKLRAADAFCLPTSAEGLPVSIMEAMAVGVPVVTTYISGIPELVVDGETGWVVPAGDEAALAGALRQALTSPERDAVTERARSRVVERHDRRTTVAELAGVLRAAHGHAQETPGLGGAR